MDRLDDPAHYDLPEAIDYILERRRLENLHLVTISKGSTAAFGMLSSKAEYNQKIRMHLTFVPVTYFEKPIFGVQFLMELLGQLSQVSWHYPQLDYELSAFHRRTASDW